MWQSWNLMNRKKNYLWRCIYCKVCNWDGEVNRDLEKCMEISCDSIHFFFTNLYRCVIV